MERLLIKANDFYRNLLIEVGRHGFTSTGAGISRLRRQAKALSVHEALQRSINQAVIMSTVAVDSDVCALSLIVSILSLFRTRENMVWSQGHPMSYALKRHQAEVEADRKSVCSLQCLIKVLREILPSGKLPLLLILENVELGLQVLDYIDPAHPVVCHDYSPSWFWDALLQGEFEPPHLESPDLNHACESSSNSDLLWWLGESPTEHMGAYMMLVLLTYPRMLLREPLCQWISQLELVALGERREEGLLVMELLDLCRGDADSTSADDPPRIPAWSSATSARQYLSRHSHNLMDPVNAAKWICLDLLSESDSPWTTSVTEETCKLLRRVSTCLESSDLAIPMRADVKAALLSGLSCVVESKGMEGRIVSPLAAFLEQFESLFEDLVVMRKSVDLEQRSVACASLSKTYRGRVRSFIFAEQMWLRLDRRHLAFISPASSSETSLQAFLALHDLPLIDFISRLARLVALALLKNSPKEEVTDEGCRTPIGKTSSSMPDLVCSISASRVYAKESPSSEDEIEEGLPVEWLMRLLHLSADLVELAGVSKRVDAPRLLADASDLSEQILLAVCGACRKLPLFAVNAEDWPRPTGRSYPTLTRKQLSRRRKEAILRIIKEEASQETTSSAYSEAFLHPFDYSHPSPSFHERLSSSSWFAQLFDALVEHSYTLQRPQDKPIYIARMFAAALSTNGTEKDIHLASIDMFHSLCKLVAQETLALVGEGEVAVSTPSLFKTLAFVAEVQGDDGSLEALLPSDRLMAATNALLSLARRLLLDCFMQKSGRLENGALLEEAVAKFLGSSYLPTLLTHVRYVPEANRKALLLAGCRLGLTAEALATAASPPAELPTRRKRGAVTAEVGRKRPRVLEESEADLVGPKRLDFEQEKSTAGFDEEEDDAEDDYEESLLLEDEDPSLSSLENSPAVSVSAATVKDEDLSWIVSEHADSSSSQDPLSSASLQPAYAEFVANLFWDPSLS